MGPFSCENGKNQDAGQFFWDATLQWGRSLARTESGADTSAPDPARELQWGRSLARTESTGSPTLYKPEYAASMGPFSCENGK